MNRLDPLFRLGRQAYALLDTWLAPLADLLARLYVAKIFFDSGLTKIHDWSITVALFTDEYRTPLLPPALAAFLGTAGELVLPVFLVLGLAGRLAALGLFGVNVMAVIAYYHVLGMPEHTAGLNAHVLWGLILALLAAHGPGRWSLDALIGKRWPELGR